MLISILFLLVLTLVCLFFDDISAFTLFRDRARGWAPVFDPQVRKAFKVFAGSAPDGCIRMKDLEKALQVAPKEDPSWGKRGKLGLCSRDSQEILKRFSRIS